MKTMTDLCFFALLTIVATSSLAADFDGSKPILCASLDILESVHGRDCEIVAAESIDAPQFIAVDLTNSDIPLDLSGLAQSARLRNRENLNGRKFLIQILQLTGGLRLPIQSISRPDIRRLQ